MTDSTKGIKNYIARYKGKFASIQRFNGWQRQTQKQYLWMRMEQLEQIIKEANEKPYSPGETADKIRYRKIQRELKSKQRQFDRMDRLDYAERCRLESLHPSQTTLERWTMSVCSSGPKEI